MNSRRAQSIFSLALLFVGNVARAQAPARDGSPTDASNPGSSLYLDAPIESLKKAAPELIDLRPASSQDPLQTILNRMADNIVGVIPRLPDLVSHEEVYRDQTAYGPTAPRKMLSVSAAGGTLAPILSAQGARGSEFRYLILCHRNPEGTVALEESRTDLKGNPIDVNQKGTVRLGSGFAYQWILFAQANQMEFRFRYLGEQVIDGRPTFVVAFAQIPGRVKVPAVFQSNGKQAPYYYQGILWIDQATSNIALLRSDLLAPLKDLSLQQLTTRLRFRAVAIREYDGTFWLPSEVRIQIDQRTLVIEEEHQYSDYHLYHSTARILP